MVDLSPHKMAMTFILIDSYSEKSDSSGREGGRSTPLQKMAISHSFWQIPTLTAQADQVADLCPTPRKWQFDIHTDRFLL